MNAGNAMGRNKYIYTLSESSIVIHSGLKGGTWEGAKENLKNSWVNLFVKKCDDKNAGNQKLIDMGGNQLIENLLTIKSLDFLFKKEEQVINLEIVKKEDKSLDKRILDLIEDQKLTIKEISELLDETQKDIKKILDSLLELGDIEKHSNKPLKFSKVVKLPGLFENE
jgi:predicted Rossmann fold nucleotide-binding protein DprA/Smf involved in DNA uptake